MRAKCWKSLPNDRVVCEVCHHACVIAPGKHGVCGVRVNKGGELHTLVAELVSSVQVDPIEKKPLYHFLPGSRVFSIGSLGCNFACDFCQNFAISRLPILPGGSFSGTKTTASALAREAERRGARSVAFTYNEPTVFFELVCSTADEARTIGLPSVLVTNGYMGDAALAVLLKRIQAANVDLKSFREDFYRKHCRAHLEPVLDSLKTMRRAGWWVEVTTLIIPGCNDSREELRDIARFIRDELGPEVPWHISRFFGAYRMQNHPPTPEATLHRAWELGRDEGLQFVYVGNMGGGLGASTFCPQCGAVCATRQGFQTVLQAVDGLCPACGCMIPGVWR